MSDTSKLDVVLIEQRPSFTIGLLSVQVALVDYGCTVSKLSLHEAIFSPPL
ncbi:hypothetical protein KIN20_023523 [Parelaphostrongylus tenuis]|uniref:Uncharacterized protein n=1 Tax=Parelaphostrongylus tenuis TaxID=148309 RepID=A0AAD5MX02_PARTN|nr:hypothetical protein KIN20_023523 [Parelaphostrongylus tenuis]